MKNDYHERDRKFLSWVRDPGTTRGALVYAREKAMREWQWQAITRELERREGTRIIYSASGAPDGA